MGDELTRRRSLDEINTSRKTVKEEDMKRTRQQILAILPKYIRNYIRNNKLKPFLNGFEDLDNILNVFFFEFGEMVSTSLHCCILWVAMMKTRVILINAVKILLQKKDYLCFEHKVDRMNELNNHLKPLRDIAAMCLQYISIFNSHMKKELQQVKNDSTVDVLGDWSFQRANLLTKHANELNQKNDDEVNKYIDFLIESYDIPKSKAKAFEKHIDTMDKRARKALYLQEIVSSKRMIMNERILATFKYVLQRFDILSSHNPEKHSLIQFNKLTNENNYYAVRKWYWILQDTYGIVLTPHIHEFEENKNPSTTDRDLVPAEKKVKDIQADSKNLEEKMVQFFKGMDVDYEKESNLYSHQRGLKQLGPFQLHTLDNFAHMIKISMVDQNHGLTYKPFPYLPSNLYLSWIEGLAGHASPISSVNLNKRGGGNNVLRVMGIEQQAKCYRFLYPLVFNKSLAQERYPEGSEQLTWIPEEFKQWQEQAEVNYQKSIKLAEQGSPIHCLFLYGGFAYYTNDQFYEATGEIDNPIQVCGLGPGDDLFFDGPYKVNRAEKDMSEEAEIRELVDANTHFLHTLKEKNLHVSEVTIGELKKRGCSRFVHIPSEYKEKFILKENMPNYTETVISTDVQNEIRKENSDWVFMGAFAYIYDDKQVHPHYFQVTHVNNITKKQDINSNTPILEKLKILESQHIDEWAEGAELSYYDRKGKGTKKKQNPLDAFKKLTVSKQVEKNKEVGEMAATVTIEALEAQAKEDQQEESKKTNKDKVSELQTLTRSQDKPLMNAQRDKRKPSVPWKSVLARLSSSRTLQTNAKVPEKVKPRKNSKNKTTDLQTLGDSLEEVFLDELEGEEGQDNSTPDNKSKGKAPNPRSSASRASPSRNPATREITMPPDS